MLQGITGQDDLPGRAFVPRLNADPSYKADTETNNAFWKPLYDQGWTDQDITNYLRSLPPDQAQKITSQYFQTAGALHNPDSTMDKVMQGLALTASMAGLGMAGGAALGAFGAAGEAGAGAAAGAGGADALGDVAISGSMIPTAAEGTVAGTAGGLGYGGVGALDGLGAIGDLGGVTSTASALGGGSGLLAPTVGGLTGGLTGAVGSTLGNIGSTAASSPSSSAANSAANSPNTSADGTLGDVTVSNSPIGSGGFDPVTGEALGAGAGAAAGSAAGSGSSHPSSSSSGSNSHLPQGTGSILSSIFGNGSTGSNTLSGLGALAALIAGATGSSAGQTNMTANYHPTPPPMFTNSGPSSSNMYGNFSSAPRQQQTHPQGINYSTYGEGPAQNFFGPIAANPLVSGIGNVNPSSPGTAMPSGGLAPVQIPGGSTPNSQPNYQQLIAQLAAQNQPHAVMARGGSTRSAPVHPETEHYVTGPGDGRSDDIDAKLSNGEYVFDAETVSHLGNGSNDAGAKRLDEMRERIRAHKGKQLVRGKMSPDAKEPMKYLDSAP